MLKAQELEKILSQAEVLEKEYNWLEATVSYKEAIDIGASEDFANIGELHERLGYALFRAARQAERIDEFEERMHSATNSFGKAKASYASSDDSKAALRGLRCDAMISYLGYWLSSEPPEKRRLVNEAWKLAKDSLDGFQDARDGTEYWRTYNQLSMAAILGFTLEWDFEPRKKLSKEAMEYGENAIPLLSGNNTYETSRAYARLSSLIILFAFIALDQAERDSSLKRAEAYVSKAKELGKETTLIEISESLSYTPFEVDGSDEALSIHKEALECCKRTKDKLGIGWNLQLLTFHCGWKMLASEDADERAELAKQSLQYAEESKNQFAIISFTSPCPLAFWVEALQSELYQTLALYETDRIQKYELLKKARAATPDLLARAEHAATPEAFYYGRHVASKTMASLAVLETDWDKKRPLMEEALKLRVESLKFYDQLQPYNYFNRGVPQNYLANIKSELASLATSAETRNEALEAAIQSKEAAIQLCLKDVQSWSGQARIAELAWIGLRQLELAEFLNRVYSFTKEKDALRRAIKTNMAAAKSYQKVGSPSRVAECYWKSAQAYDSLGEVQKAIGAFQTASNHYEEAANKLPQLKSLFADQASYMRAWAEIETARYHHRRQEYGLAEQSYAAAATLHESSRQWSIYASNYSAWSYVEKAEKLSRDERSEESLNAFQEAEKLFEKTGQSLRSALSILVNEDEKQLASRLISAAGLRSQYCKARGDLEEARILDKNDDHSLSSEKYESAANTLEEIFDSLETEEDQREIKLIMILSRAWQMMSRAEAEASPELYLEASRLFEEAKELSANEREKKLVTGHSRLCKALEAGRRYSDTGDPSLYGTAVQHFEGASIYYVEAGFGTASDYAKASKLLLDAYSYMNSALTEADHEKKAKFYLMTEKVLEASANSYSKASSPSRKEQVMRLLEKVKEERELAMSLTQVLRAPTVVSSAAAFSAPTPSAEKPVGLERFDHANIQTNMIAARKSLKVGEELNVEIELVNAGRGSAQLVKLEEVVPEGFELTEKPDAYRLEESYLNMKGKRLDPLKTEEVRLVLKPRTQGHFTLKPRILYLDEIGRYMSHEPEPIEIAVTELGISGWIKGHSK